MLNDWDRAMDCEVRRKQDYHLEIETKKQGRKMLMLSS
jgi:hypothetical protein